MSATLTTELPRVRSQAFKTLWCEDLYPGIDAGVRFAVKVLHATGIETCESCDGHVDGEAWVRLPMTGSDAQGFAAIAALRAYGLDVRRLEIVWPVHDGLPGERSWRVVLRPGGYPERADEVPWCLHGCVGQESSSSPLDAM